VKSILLGCMLAFSSAIAFAEDWTTTDGTNYQNVRVVRVEDDAVTILYKDGGALVFLNKLPPALQDRFDYDPVKAKIAAEARAKSDAENAVALQKEIEQAASMKRQQQIKDAAALSSAPPSK
jgi:translation elongation factor P/translation initiation factor 5A